MSRVGVLSTSYPRWPGDFAGSFVEGRVLELAGAGAQLDVLAAGDGSIDQRHPADHATGGVRVHRIPPARGAPRLFYDQGAPEALEAGGAGVWLQGLWFWAGLCQAIRAHAPRWSRVEAHWLVPCGLAARVVVPGLPLTIHAHSGDVALLERLPFGGALARALATASPAPHFVFASRNLLDRFAERARTTSDRLVAEVRPAASFPPLPVERDPGERSRARTLAGVEADARLVLGVGRLVPIKGFDVLVRAVARLPADSGDPARRGPILALLGDGPERRRLQTLAARLGVTLLLPGFVPRDRVRAWMTAADLYVQPSRPLASGRTEGTPVATLEALAAGLPVVASATGGLGEVPVGPPRFRLVPPDDPIALARYLEL